MTTDDAGATWQYQRLPQTDWVRRASFISERRGWIIGHWNDVTGAESGRSKIFQTDNGGGTWRELPSTLGLDFSVYGLNDIAFVDSLTGFLVANPSSSIPQEQAPYPGLVFTTRDGGARWTKLDIGTKRKFNQVLFLDRSRGFLLSQPYYSEFDFDSTLLYRTTDGGKVWSLVPGMGFGRLHFTDGRVGWAGNFRTTDGGVSWVHLSFGVPQAAGSLEKISFADSLTGYAISQGVIFQTEDAGASFTVQLETGQYLTDIQFFDVHRGYASGYGGVIYHTSDGGLTWLRSGQGVTEDLEDVDFVDASTGWAVGHAGTILHTSDGGLSWVLQTVPAECRQTDFRGAHFLDRQKGWATGGAYVLGTTDGGTTWRVQLTYAMPQPSGRLRDVKFLNSQVGFVVGQESFAGPGILCRTLDGGSSWLRTGGLSAQPLAQISFCSPSAGWICGDGVMLSTADAGNTWQEMNRPAGFLRAMEFADCQHGWVSSQDEGGVYRTIDGGQSWSAVPYVSRFNQFFSNLWFRDNWQGIATSYFFCNILTSTDGGVHWSYQERLPPARLNAMAFVNDTLGWAVGTSGTILRFQGSYFRQGGSDQGSTILVGNYPNPFNKQTTIVFQLPEPQSVTLTVFNALGQKVTELVNEEIGAGHHEVQFNAIRLASGVYFYRLQAGEKIFTRSMVSVK